MSQDIETGATALKAYVQSVDGWEANFVPWNDYEQGAQVVMTKWDSGGKPANPEALASLHAACGTALFKVISDAGYGEKVTQEQCAAGANAVIAAVVAGRA